MKTSAEKELLKDFNSEVEVASPGRINLIGEHTDYNHGFVMPTAIDKKIYFRFRKSESETLCRIYSETYDAHFEFNLNSIARSTESWHNYILGVVKEIQLSGRKIGAFDCIIRTELPIGAGISSSAALECGLAGGLNKLFDLQLSDLEIVKLSQKAENNFVGSNCGIMDQFASVMSKKDHLLVLDCDTLDTEFIPADFRDCKLLLLNTRVSHNLADSEYNTRRQECETAVEVIQEKYSKITSLRDVGFGMLEEFKDKLPGESYKRSQYVLQENQRVQKAAKAMRNGNLKLFGELMYQSHRGLQHDYEVSCKELDFLVDFSEDKDYIYGSRMMGGGFGGCTINLIKADKIDEYVAEVAAAYQKEFNIEPEAIVVLPSGGTEIR